MPGKALLSHFRRLPASRPSDLLIPLAELGRLLSVDVLRTDLVEVHRGEVGEKVAAQS